MTIVNDPLKKSRLAFGDYLSFIIRRTPKRILNMLSYYQFADNLIEPHSRILDIGCSEGMGSCLLSKNANLVKGIDFDEEAIDRAKKLWKKTNLQFEKNDFRNMKHEKFDAVVSFDVIEHIEPSNFSDFFLDMVEMVKDEGMLIMGSPSLEMQAYVNEHTKKGHVNCLKGEEMKAWLNKSFHHSFVFSANDELVHTGFYPMACYLIGVGFLKK